MAGVLEAKLQQDRRRWWSYKLNSSITTEITSLQANKQETRYRLKDLEVSKLEQSYGWCFEGQSTTPKVNGTFSAVKKKKKKKVSLVYLECKLQQGRYGWCIYKLKCKKTVRRTSLDRSKQQTRYRLCF